MRNWVLLFCAFLLFAIASPVLLRAQFQAPTQEELKMTSDPKAPGADAVYLYREEITDDVAQYHSYYERIKVLTEKGMELATIRIPYEKGEFKVTKIEGRTIHPDGTVIPLSVKPEDLVVFKTKSHQENTIVFTLPNVEVGSILEYRLQIHYSGDIVVPPRWDIQQTYFVHKAHYFFRPQIGEYSSRRGYEVIPAKGPIVVESDKDGYKVDLTDIPPVPDEDWAPPLNTICWRVEFYYTYAHSDKEFWDSAGSVWAMSNKEFIKPSGALKRAAAQMVAPNDSDEQKARKVYAEVMKLDNTDYSRVKSEAERKKEKLKEIDNVNDVWTNQAGPGNSIALLYVALARAVGLKAWPMEVVDRNSAFFDAAYLDERQLQDYIAVLVIDGKDVFVDPGQKMCPFGSLHWAHQLVGGLRLTESGAVIAGTPASTYKDNVTQRIADLAIDAQGNVKGTVRFVMTGAEALYWRQLALQNAPDEVKRQFDEWLQTMMPEGVEAHVDHFLGLDDPDSNLLATVNAKGVLGAAVSKRLLLPELFFESREHQPFVDQAKRLEPVDMHYGEQVSDQVVYHLPPGFSVEGAPQDVNDLWPGKAEFIAKTQTAPGQVTVTSTLARAFDLVDPSDYQDLRGFYQKVATASQAELVLDAAAAAKSNR
jgi:transglutaminase-like putative cysteine protease